MPFDAGHALVIGVGSYQYAPQKNVLITAADAQAIVDVLQDPNFCGYPQQHITLLHEASATRAGILAALDDLAARTTEESTVLLFYSGHGDYAADDTYHLTTHDTRFDGNKVIRDTGVGEYELMEKVGRLRAKRVLLVFNACHAGEISPTLGTTEQEPLVGKNPPQQTTAALLSTGSGRMIITACREEQVSFIGSGKLTIFAQAFSDGLRGKGIRGRAGYISLFDLYTYLYFTVSEAVEDTIPEAVRAKYSTTQEPELTILKGVGPFAVSLFKGATTLGSFPETDLPPEETAVTQVSDRRSKHALQRITGMATVQGNNTGQNVGVSTGSMTQQNIHNDAPNQGAQGTFQGPVTFNQQGQKTYNAKRDLIQTGRDYIAGDRVQGDKVGGDKISIRGDQVQGNKNVVHGSQTNIGGNQINAQGSQGFINQATGPVEQQFGDRNTVSNVSGGAVAVGHQAQAQNQSQQGGDMAAFAEAFAQIHTAINERPADPDVDKDELTTTVQSIEEEARKGEQANEKKLTRWFHSLALMAEDIFDVTVAALSGPHAAFATVARKVAAKAKESKG